MSAWHGIPRSGRCGASAEPPGVHMAALADTTVLAIIARIGREAEVGESIHARFGIDLPSPGKANFARDADAVWMAPRQWLLFARTSDPVPALRAQLRAVASVVDQSDARGLLRIGGHRCRDMLAKGLAIDLHPSRFSTGSAASTSVTHVNVLIWQDNDAPTYMIAVPRSFAGSFWSWVTVAAAEYGYEVNVAAA